MEPVLFSIQHCLHVSSQKQVHINRIFADFISIAADGSQETRYIGRAAGTAEPFLALHFYMHLVKILLACLRHHFQGIHIEKFRTVQRHAGDHPVVKCPLHHIGITAVLGDLEHPPGKEDQSDGSAGLCIDRIIGQIVVKGEGFSVSGGSDGSCHIHLLFHNIIPEPFAGFKQLLILCSACHLRHAGIQIHCPHRMAFCLVLLSHRQPCLVILILEIAVFPEKFRAAFLFLLGKIQGLLSSLIDEIFCQLQMPFVLCDAIEGYQSHLCHLVSRIAPLFPGFSSQILIGTVDKGSCHIQKLSLSCGMIICHRSLHHMSHTVHFMVVGQIGKSLVQSV